MPVDLRLALGVLTKARLLEVASKESHEGPTRKRKDEIVEALASSGRVALDQLLAHYTRDELKSACEAAGLSTKGREKAVIVARLLGDDDSALPSPSPPITTRSATTRSAKKSAPNKNGSLGFEQELWKAADLLRNNMDPAEYKHVVLGLLFLKYIEDAFEERRNELFLAVSDPSSEYFTPDEADREPEIAGLLEDPDEYLAANVFWVPEEARWSYLRSKAKQPEIGKLVDGAMDAIERDNPSLKGVLPKVYALPNLDKTNLGKLIDIVSGIGLGSKEHKDKDTLGRVHVVDVQLDHVGLRPPELPHAHQAAVPTDHAPRPGLHHQRLRLTEPPQAGHDGGQVLGPVRARVGRVLVEVPQGHSQDREPRRGLVGAGGFRGRRAGVRGRVQVGPPSGRVGPDAGDGPDLECVFGMNSGRGIQDVASLADPGGGFIFQCSPPQGRPGSPSPGARTENSRRTPRKHRATLFDGKEGKPLRATDLPARRAVFRRRFEFVTPPARKTNPVQGSWDRPGARRASGWPVIPVTPPRPGSSGGA